MELGIGAYGFGLLAGILTTLSPCVLPILPVLLGSATTAHPRAPLVLALGLAVSYAIIGTGIAWMGASLGINTAYFRYGGAIILGLFGVILLSGGLQQRFANATSGIGNAGNTLLNKISPEGLKGQFLTGLVLGVIWSPCVGPTLGGAIMLASQGSHLPQVALVMGIFGIGAALPVVALAYVSRSFFLHIRGKLMHAGKTGKLILGGIMIAIAIFILTGADKTVEVWLLNIIPDWMTSLTTRF